MCFWVHYPVVRVLLWESWDGSSWADFAPASTVIFGDCLVTHVPVGPSWVSQPEQLSMTQHSSQRRQWEMPVIELQKHQFSFKGKVWEVCLWENHFLWLRRGNEDQKAQGYCFGVSRALCRGGFQEESVELGRRVRGPIWLCVKTRACLEIMVTVQFSTRAGAVSLWPPTNSFMETEFKLRTLLPVPGLPISISFKALAGSMWESAAENKQQSTEGWRTPALAAHQCLCYSWSIKNMVITERKKTGQEVAQRRQQMGKQQKEQPARVQRCPMRGCRTGSRMCYLPQFRVLSSVFIMIEKYSYDK